MSAAPSVPGLRLPSLPAVVMGVARLLLSTIRFAKPWTTYLPFAELVLLGCSRSNSFDGKMCHLQGTARSPCYGNPKSDLSPFLRNVNSVIIGEWVDEEDPNDVAKAGETFPVTYEVTNRGTTTLLDFCITDEKYGDTCLGCTVSGDGNLPPDESFDCTIDAPVSLSRLVSIFRAQYHVVLQGLSRIEENQV